MQHRTVRANDQRIHLVEQGSGPLVLLVHGFPESWFSWRHQLEALADAGYRVVAYDQRGYGRSSKPGAVEAYRITELVADAAGVVEVLGESSAVIVGHDWGAPVAWTAAWTKPEVFTAVAGLSVPFGGRGLVPLADISPFGEVRPSEAHRLMAGSAERTFYQELFSRPGAVEAEFEADVRAWITGILYSVSGSPPAPPELAALDPSQLTAEMVVEITRASPACIPAGGQMRDGFALPEQLPSWLSGDDLDVYVAEFERTGITGGLSYYRAMDLGWEELAAFEGRRIEVPALFIGGTRDLPTMWGLEALSRAGQRFTDLRGIEIFDGCGHWTQQEEPQRTSAALAAFLDDL